MTTIIRALCVVAIALITAACQPSEQPAIGSESARPKLGDNQNYKDFGDYVLHVNALSTNQLSPDVAVAYGIVRSENRAMLNVALLRKDAAGGPDKSVEADIKVKASNLTMQLKDFEVRKLVEGDAIYYIGELNVSNEEVINFDIDAIPAGQKGALKVRFSKQFYTR